MNFIHFAEAIKEVGGTAYLVGGYVRDVLLNKTPKDIDIVITGLTEETFIKTFPIATQIGKSFPIFSLLISNNRCEVALARTERKIGRGYNGFSIQSSPNITIEDDLYRRDTTMNSIAINILTNKIVDPYNGSRDIKKHLIKATSQHFVDDPVRSLRAARQSSQFNFKIHDATYEQMKNCQAELTHEPRERFMSELEKALNTPKPSIFFRALQKANLLSVTYPQIHALIGQTQPPEYHPEGDAFEHTMNVVDEVAKITPRIEVRFAALMHDIGKSLTEKSKLPKHYNHDQTGLIALNELNNHMTLPRLWIKCAQFAIENHMRAKDLTRPGKIVELLKSLHKNPIQIDGFIAILTADLTPIPQYLLNYDKLIMAINSVSGTQAPPHLVGKEIGQWLTQQQTKFFQKAKRMRE